MNYAPVRAIPSIGGTHFAVFHEKPSRTTAPISLIFKENWPSQGAAEQRKNSEKTAAETAG
jgi:hypothetical protein